MTSHDLKHALAAVADVERAATDPAADLDRARGAARRRTRQRFRLGLGALAATTVVAVGVTLVVDPTRQDEPASVTPTAGVELVSQPFAATPYTFDLTPRGWSVQGQDPTVVTIAPDDGSTSDDPLDFRGKLVILFDANPPDGRELQRDGRDFWVSNSADYTTVATLSRDDEPSGVVRIQYPDDAGWDLDAMVAFLGSVHVGPGARHSVG